MKKLLILAALCVTPFLMHAQTAKNEFKVNVGYLLAGLPELTYEWILNDESAMGLSVAFALDDIDYKFGLTPYYRLYFGEKRAGGFFIEGNGAVFSEDNYENGNSTGVGLGIATGGKFLTDNNWVGEIYLGFGRNFVNDDKISEAYPRFGLVVGRRF